MLTPEERTRLLELITQVEKAEKCCCLKNAIEDKDGKIDFDATCAPCPYKGERCDDSDEDPKKQDMYEVFSLVKKALKTSEELTKAGYSLIVDRIVNREVNPPQDLDTVGLLNWCSAYAQCQNDILDIIAKLRDNNRR